MGHRRAARGGPLGPGRRAAASGASPTCAGRSTRSRPARSGPSSWPSWARPRPHRAIRPARRAWRWPPRARSRDSARAQTLERLGGALWLLGQESAATEAFERGLVQDEDGDAPRIARMQAGLLMASRFQPELRERAMERLDPMLREPGFSRPREPGVLACIAFERALAGRRSARVSELAERALEGGAPGRPDALPGPECFAACCALVWADSLSTAEIALTMALESARRRGHAGAAAAASRFRAWTVLQRGRLSHAAADALDSSSAKGDGPMAAVPSAAMILAEVDMEQGRLEEAALLLEDPGPAHLLGGRPPARLPPRRARAAPLPPRRARHGARGPARVRAQARVARRPQSHRAALALPRGGRRRGGARRRPRHEPGRRARCRWPVPSAPRGRSGSRFAPRRSWGRRRTGSPGCARPPIPWSARPGRSTGPGSLIDLGGELRRGGHRREARERLRVGPGPGAPLRGLGARHPRPRGAGGRRRPAAP